LVLNVEFSQDDKSSRYEVTAQILPASLFDEEDIQPDPIRPNRAGVSSTEGDRDGINIGEARDFATKRIKKVGSKFQVQVWSKKAKDFIPQGQPWATMAQAEKDAAKFVKNEGVNEVFPAKSAGPTRFKGDPKVKVDKVKGGFQVFVHSPRGFWIAQGQPWKTEALAKKDAKKFNEGVNEAFKAPPKGTIAKAEKTRFGFQVLVWSFDQWHPEGKPRSSMAKAQADAKKINAGHKKKMNEAGEVPDFRPEQPSILFKGRYKLVNDLDDRDGGQGRKGNIVMARKDTESFDTLLGQPMFKVKIEKSLKDLVVSYEDLEQL